MIPMFHKLSQVINSLKMHPLRALLSLIGIAIGISATVILLNAGEGAKRKILAEIEQLGMRNVMIRSLEKNESQSHAVASKQLPFRVEDAHRLQVLIPQINQTVSIKNVDCKIGRKMTITPEVLATTPEFSNLYKLSISQGRFITKWDLKQKNRVCVIGSCLAETLGVHGKVGRKIDLDQRPYEIVGIMGQNHSSSKKIGPVTPRNYNEAIIIPLTSALLSWGDTIQEMILQAKDKKDVLSIASVIPSILDTHKNANRTYQIVIPDALYQQAIRSQRTLNLVLGMMAAISLCVGGIGVMNMMLAGVFERTQEIGIRRSIGATKHAIFSLFMQEALFLTLVGGIIGIVFGIIASIILSYFSGWDIVISFIGIGLSFFLTVIVGCTAGIYPAVKACQVSPLDALRKN